MPMPSRQRLAFVAVATLVVLLGSELAAQPALLRAVRVRSAEDWQAQLRNRADVAARDDAGNTALHFAALNHDLPAVEALLAAGAPADEKNTAQATPLLYGAGHAGIVRVLLARGANPNAASALKITPLMVAVSQPDGFAAAEALLAAGADLHAPGANNLQPVLIRAVTYAGPRTIDLVLARGAAKHAPTAAAALSAAASRGDKAVVERLLALGADPNLNPVFAGHALNNALWSTHLDVATLLIERGADLGLRSPSGHATPPMVWAGYNQRGDPAIARALVARGVDVNLANEQGSTALSYALRNGPQSPLVHYLRSVGAKEPTVVRTKPMPDRAVPSDPAARAALVRERMPATVALLQRSSDAFLENGFVRQTGCTSCHGQDLPAVVYGLARERGFSIDENSLGRQLEVQMKRWSSRGESARQMVRPVPGAPAAVAYGLYGLHAAGYPADDTTDAMTRWLLRIQQADGSWSDPTVRPPMEDGSYVATGWVTLSLRDYPPAGYEREVASAQARAARWLAANAPTTHNESVMQLLGLYWSGGAAAEVQSSAARLVRTQRADGGWAQLPGLASDAWATGSALVALHEGAGMKTTDPVYQRGVAFLLRTQYEDGSWWVKGRSWPFQPHFNSQFPHGRDQWISQGGTAWAAMALLYTLAPVRPAPARFNGRDLIAAYAQSPAARRAKAAPAAAGVGPRSGGTVDFARDIRPIFERSCAGCHSGEKPRAGFVLDTREALLKGGGSGEPAIVPGAADESVLIQYVTGKIEDLEMPPLDRREKYPALTPAEIEQLKAWIDAGAPWATVASPPGTVE